MRFGTSQNEIIRKAVGTRSMAKKSIFFREIALDWIGGVTHGMPLKAPNFA